MKNLLQSLIPALAFSLAFVFAAEVRADHEASQLTPAEVNLFNRWAREPENRDAIRVEYFADVEREVAQIKAQLPMTLSPYTRLFDLTYTQEGNVMHYHYRVAATELDQLTLTREEAWKYISKNMCNDIRTAFLLQVMHGEVRQSYYLRNSSEPFSLHIFDKNTCETVKEDSVEKVSV